MTITFFGRECLTPQGCFLNNAICSKSRFSCSLLKNIQVHIVTDIKVRTSQVTGKWRLDRTLTDTLCVRGAQPPAELGQVDPNLVYLFKSLEVTRISQYKNEVKKCKDLKGTFKGIGQFWKKEFLNTPTSVIRLYPCGRRSGTQKPQSGEILLCSGDISLKILIRNSDPKKSGCKVL